MRRALLLASFCAGVLMGSSPPSPSLAVTGDDLPGALLPSAADERLTAVQPVVDATLASWLARLVDGGGPLRIGPCRGAHLDD